MWRRAQEGGSRGAQADDPIAAAGLQECGQLEVCTRLYPTDSSLLGVSALPLPLIIRPHMRRISYLKLYPPFSRFRRCARRWLRVPMLPSQFSFTWTRLQARRAPSEVY